MKKKVLVMGGGLAGLATAYVLHEASRGELDITVLERGHILGGKASSKAHTREGRAYEVDHGLHVYFDYPNFDRILDEVGALGGLRGNKHRMWVWRDGKLVAFQSYAVPSPFHWVGGIPVVGFTNALKLSRVMLAAAMVRPEKLSAAERKRLDEMSWDEFGAELGVPPELLQSELYRFFGRSGFHFPFPASAFTILRATRLVAQSHAALLTRYIDGPLGDRMCKPLANALIDRGVQIKRFHEVHELVSDGDRLKGVEVEEHRFFPHKKEEQSPYLSNYHTVLDEEAEEEAGDEPETSLWEADFYVSALAPRDLVGVLDDAMRSDPYFGNVDKIQTQPSIAYQVYYDRLVTPDWFTDAAVGLPGAFSTVFDRARIWTQPDGTGSILEWVSELGEFKDRSDEDVMADADAMALKLFPKVAEATVVRRFYHRGGHDTFTLTVPGSDAHRPPARSPLKNLVLAGDYVNNAHGVVCMEGTVVSAIEAANIILEQLGYPPRAVAPMSEPGGFVPAIRKVSQLLGRQRKWFGFAETD